MTESDGIEEALEGTLRVAVTAAARVGEQLARLRQAQAVRAQAAGEQEGRELAARLDAERAAARAHLAPVHADAWWDGADARAIGLAHTTAQAWAGLDPEADRAAQRIRTELRTRYGVDADHAGGDPAAVNDAIAAGLRTEAQRHNRDVKTSAAEARTLLAYADRVDLGAEAVRVQVEDHREAFGVYDSAQRRQQMAAELDGRADAASVNARVVADISQAQHPKGAIVTRGSAPKAARRTRAGQQRQRPAMGRLVQCATSASGRLPSNLPCTGRWGRAGVRVGHQPSGRRVDADGMRYRFTGVAGPGVGVQRERHDDDREIARRVLNLLADRRMLWKDWIW